MAIRYWGMTKDEKQIGNTKDEILAMKANAQRPAKAEW